MTLKFYNRNFSVSNARMFSYIEAFGGDEVFDIIDPTTGLPYRVHKFTTVGESTFEVKKVSGIEEFDTIEYLVVAGGGGAGHPFGGGGGAGQVIHGFVIINNTKYTIFVGAGGLDGKTAGTAVGISGNQSSAFSIIALPGGGGGRQLNTPSGEFGSGGGAGGDNNNDGATGVISNGERGYSTAPRGGGGGGGAGGNGGLLLRGQGGPGVSSFITGEPKFYGGGGNGAKDDSITPWASVPGGSGIGGNGAHNGGGNGGNGAVNTGSGGGSAWNSSANSGSGGSGIVIVRYRIGRVS